MPTLPPPPDGPPPGCDPVDQWGDSTYCSMSLECKDAESWTSCYIADSKRGLWQCECSYQDGDRYTSTRANLKNLGSIDPCEFTSNLCGENTTIDFDGPETCGLVSETVQNDRYCQQEGACTKTEEFDGGVQAELTTRSYGVWCDSTSNDQWSCMCPYQNYASYEMSTALDTRGVCATGINVCDEGVSLDPTSPSECVITSSSGARNGSSCNATLDCGQTVSIPDADVTMYGTLWSNCSHGSGNDWSCECGNNYESAQFDFTSSGGTAAKSCEEAVTHCHDEDLVPITSDGSSGDGGVSPGPRPIPL